MYQLHKKLECWKLNLCHINHSINFLKLVCLPHMPPILTQSGCLYQDSRTSKSSGRLQESCLTESRLCTSSWQNGVRCIIICQEEEVGSLLMWLFNLLNQQKLQLAESAKTVHHLCVQGSKITMKTEPNHL